MSDSYHRREYVLVCIMGEEIGGAPMTGYLASAHTLCLLNENAQCNPIWVSQPDGLRLVHFQTFQEEISGKEHAPVDAGYEKCERQCLQAGHL